MLPTTVWSFAKEAYEGSGGFLNGDYIDQYPRESDQKYFERQRIAYYTNLFAPKVNRYVGYLFKKKPNRSSSSDLVQLIFDDCDQRGNTIDVFMEGFAKEAKVRGSMLLLVDMPKELPPTLAAQKRVRALPFFRAIEPERIVEYRLDRFGSFEYVRFSDTIDQKPVVRHYDKAGWKILDGEDVIEAGSHDLGITPVLIFTENGRFPAIGEFTQIAFLARRHYNLQSELDEILRSQTFSILTIQGGGVGNGSIKAATDNAILYAKDAERPAFIAPPAAPAEIYMQRIKDIEAQIDAIAYDITTNRSHESGIALDIKFQGLNASLSNFAMRLSDLENRAFDLVCRYLGIENDVTIAYPSSFSIVDIQKEIDILEQLQNLIDAPTYFRLKALQIIANDLGNIDPEDFAKIASEIEDSQKD